MKKIRIVFIAGFFIVFVFRRLALRYVDNDIQIITAIIMGICMVGWVFVEVFEFIKKKRIK